MHYHYNVVEVRKDIVIYKYSNSNLMFSNMMFFCHDM